MENYMKRGCAQRRHRILPSETESWTFASEHESVTAGPPLTRCPKGCGDILLPREVADHRCIVRSIDEVATLGWGSWR
jgi:hypothetical protein